MLGLRLLVLGFCLTLPSVAVAGSCAAPEAVRFPAGSSRQTIESGVGRGELACWRLRAKAGQTMSVTVTSVEDNAAATIYRPDWRVRRDGDGLVSVRGQTLPAAGEGDDARTWSGPLPATGEYLVAIGAVRGGADFRLTIAIR